MQEFIDDGWNLVRTFGRRLDVGFIFYIEPEVVGLGNGVNTCSHISILYYRKHYLTQDCAVVINPKQKAKKTETENNGTT